MKSIQEVHLDHAVRIYCAMIRSENFSDASTDWIKKAAVRTAVELDKEVTEHWRKESDDAGKG